MKLACFIFLLMVCGHTSWAQSIPKKEVDLESFVDELLAVQDEDINYEDLYENLAQLLSNPADLNTITDEQLRSLFILNEIQIQSFIDYRNQAEPFLSVYELQNVEGIDHDDFLKLAPFVDVPDVSSAINKTFLKRILHEKNNYLVFRYDRTLEEKKGYESDASQSGKYAGSPDKLYTRFRTSRPGDFSFGFTAEKDAGEKSSWKPSQRQYGADFISFHAQAINKGKLKNLIVGDYQAQFGQGLTLGSAFGIGKNSEAVTTVRRANVGFLPYTSLYEAGFFRGTAFSYSINKKITAHVMYSSRWRDGNVSLDTISEPVQIISSLSYTGLHRTTGEIENRNTVQEKNIAAVVSYKINTLDAGLIIHRTQFGSPLLRKPMLYNQFYFEGGKNTNVGGYLNYAYKNFSFFSEVSSSTDHGMGVTAGILASLAPSLDFSLHYRKFDRNFYTFYSNALAESTTPQNETGMYWGWKYVPNKKYSFSGYLDLFRFTWLRYRSYAPSEGSEWLFRFNYKPAKNIVLFLQAREETKVRNSTTNDNLYRTAPGTRRNYWINADYAVSTQLSFRTRAQFNSYSHQGATTHGMALLQDVTWSAGKLSISGRYALFDAADYDNRLYVYEKDVWLAFSFPAYYGVGIRNYVLLQYSLSKKVDVWLRWAHVRYTDRDTIGSGSETINGNIRNDVKFQMRLRL
jgi:Helix-hairpin-helix motif